MASDYLLEIDGIKGESQDSKHPGALEVMSFSWGLANPSSIGSATGGAGAGRATFQDFHFTHKSDSASPQLMLACATGEHIKTATLTVRKAGRDQAQEYLKIELSDLLISSFKQDAVLASETDPTPTESVSLNFAKIQYSQATQKPDGTLGDATSGGWDLKSNKKV